MPGTPETLPSQDVRKVGMTSNQHGPYVRGYTRVTMGGTEGRYLVTGCQSRKSHGAVNTFPGLVHTARQAMKAGGA